MNVLFHPDAKDELLKSQEWYKVHSKIAARAFTTEFAWSIRQIKESPTRWKRHIKDTHKFEMNHFPFSIIYKISDETIVIVALAHHKRKPNYWKKR